MTRRRLELRFAFDSLYARSLALLRRDDPRTQRNGDAEHHSARWRLVTAAAMIAMALVGWSVSAADSVVLTLVVAVFLLPALWLVPSIRFPFVIIGGLTILYSSSSLDKAKFLYLAGMLVVCAVALRQLPSRRAT